MSEAAINDESLIKDELEISQDGGINVSKVVSNNEDEILQTA